MNLMTGSGIVEALVRAKDRSVDVRLIAEKTTPRRPMPDLIDTKLLWRGLIQVSGGHSGDD